MSRLSWLYAALLCALLAGCGATVPKIGGKLRPKRYIKIVSLSPGASEVLGSYIDAKHFAGRTESDDYPPNVKGVRIVASVKPNYEEIAKIQPDLVVYDPVLYSTSDIEKIKGIGAQTFSLDGDTVDEYIKSLARLGTLVGSETQIAEYTDRIYAAKAVGSSDPPNPRPRVAIILPGNGSEHMIAGIKSFQGDEIRAAGGEPVGPESNRFEPLNAEAFIKMDPQVLVIAGQKTSVVNDPRLKGVSAMKSGRVFAEAAPVAGKPPAHPLEDMLVRRGVRVDQLIDLIHQAVAQKS